MRSGISTAGSMHTLAKTRLFFWGAGIPESGVLSAYVSGRAPNGEEVYPGRAGRAVAMDLGRIGWHTYQTCQRDLGRDAGWKLGTWRLMHGLGPASASVLPCLYCCPTEPACVGRCLCNPCDGFDVGIYLLLV